MIPDHWKRKPRRAFSQDLCRRFLAKLKPDPKSECILWTGAQSKGYGQIRTPSGMKKAHRFSFELFRGPILFNFQLDHLCRNKLCTNPYHLELVSLRTHAFISNKDRQKDLDTAGLNITLGHLEPLSEDPNSV